MKVRTDFVTNSSSSSFVFARKGDMSISNETKLKIADVVLRHFIDQGKPLEDTIQEFYYGEDFEVDGAPKRALEATQRGSRQSDSNR